MAKQCLQKLTNKPRDVENDFFVLDIETDKLEATPESFVFCCLYGKNFFRYFYSVEAVKTELLKPKYKRKTIFAHNGEFDFSAIFGNIMKFDPTSIFAGSQLITFTNGNCKFGDSMNLLKASVLKVGKALGIEKLENEQILKQLENRIVTPEAREYCKQDCKIVFTALTEIFRLTGRVRLTIASCSLTLFRSKYQTKNLYYDKELSDKFFGCFYGGRTEAIKIGKTFSHKYDVNSMYPWIMLNAKFPDPDKLKEYTGNDWDYFKEFYFDNPKFEGMAYVTVQHPKTKFGFLPYRSENKLTFPTGTFSGMWTFCELRNAVKNGVEIIEWVSAIYSPSIDSIFKNYVTELFELRQLNKGNFKELVFKYFLNSLFGKFGEKNKWKQQYFEEMPIEFIKELQAKDIQYKIHPFSIKRDDLILSWDSGQHKKNSIPVFASYITALGRVHLVNLMEKYQHLKITYVDTDSICCEVPEVQTGSALGELKKETSIITEIKGLKYYTEIDNGIETEKIKGVPKKAVKEGNIYTFKNMVKTKSGLRRNLVAGKFVEILKNIETKYNKRQILHDGDTEPLEILQGVSYDAESWGIDTRYISPIDLIKENWRKLNRQDILKQTNLLIGRKKDINPRLVSDNGKTLDNFTEEIQTVLEENGFNYDFTDTKNLILEFILT